MSFPETSPKYLGLHDKLWLRPCKGYAMLHGFSIRNKKIIEPWEAFILALCNGKIKFSEIVYLFSETFGVNNPEAHKAVNLVIKRYSSYIEISEKPLECSNKFDPFDFIMASKIDEIGIGRRPLDIPWVVSLITSYRCNFNCRYCYLPDFKGITNSESISCTLETCRKVIEESCSWGVPFIGINGGEPLLFPKWEGLAEQVIAGGSVPLITTNGSLIGKREAERIAEIGIPQMIISLEATDAEMFSSITGTSVRMFSRVINAITFLRENGVKVTIKGVCMPENVQVIGELIDMLIDLDVEAIHFSRMERGHPSGPSWHCPTVTEEDLKNVRSIARQRSESYSITITGPRELYDDVFPCGSLHLAIGIMPPGIVGICEKFAGKSEFNIGDVREQTLKEIWYGERANNFRKRCIDPLQVGEQCSSCNNLQNCMTGCFFDSYMATGNILEKPIYCKGPHRKDHKAEIK